jgi:fused signal recognition particle receptor
MFGNLKEKLKSWVKKNEEPEIVKETKNPDKKEEKKELKRLRRENKKLEKEIKKELRKKEKGAVKAKISKEEKAEPSQDERVEQILTSDVGAGAKRGKTRENEKSVREGETLKLPEEPSTKTDQEESLQKVLDPGKKSFFDKFSKKLTEEKFDEIFEELEFSLLENNVALEAIERIKESLAEKLIGNSLKQTNLAEELKNSILQLLINPGDFIAEIKDSLEVKSPFVILFVGINGAGKTTTIAKIASLLQKNKLSACLAAADTFRAASIEQLQQHADNLNIPLIKKDYGSDPAAVGFDAVAYAKKNKVDVVLIDTAGRMQNKDSLMKEIEKVSRVTKPDMKIFLGESITGNDATKQAKAFNDSIDLTGTILSKADVDEKGGTAISVSHVTKKPILFLGTGQEYEDLEVFDKENLIEKLGL